MRVDETRDEILKGSDECLVENLETETSVIENEDHSVETGLIWQVENHRTAVTQNDECDETNANENLESRLNKNPLRSC